MLARPVPRSRGDDATVAKSLTTPANAFWAASSLTLAVTVPDFGRRICTGSSRPTSLNLDYVRSAADGVEFVRQTLAVSGPTWHR